MKKLKKKINRSARSIQTFCPMGCVGDSACERDPSGYARQESYLFSQRKAYVGS